VPPGGPIVPLPLLRLAFLVTVEYQNGAWLQLRPLGYRIKTQGKAFHRMLDNY
jgi:hypothetical protein